MTPAQSTRLLIEQTVAPFGATLDEALSHDRRRRCTVPRQVAYAAVRERTSMSLPQIGRTFGGRDHTTIIHGLQQHEARLAWADFLIWAGKPEGQRDLFWRDA